MRKHLFIVLSLLVVAGLAPSACQPPPAPTPVPAEEEAPSEEEEEATPTEESTPTPKSTIDPVALALEGVTSNDEWTPYIQEFDSVPMALVPAGCFVMGSTEDEVDYAFELCEEALGEGECGRDWFEDETPQHEICFNEPFWIDVYEVTNAQYGSSGEWSGDNLPRESLTWLNAVAHCEGRGARLPTEAEWEYAARGPDRLIFPWGNTFDGSRLNSCDSNCRSQWADTTVDDGYEYTAPVGSYQNGVSWVGAHDMSGNVWEWVSSIYEPYPYDPTDGREVDASSDRGRDRGWRGGSWIGVDLSVRAACRGRVGPTITDYADGGVRCARSY